MNRATAGTIEGTYGVEEDGMGQPTVYLLAGVTGSGKTTYAKALAAQGVRRLSVDEQVHARHGRYGIDYPEHHYFDLERPILAEVHDQLQQLVHDGHDVVLDHGLWRRADRDLYKKLVEQAGGQWRLLYFSVGRDELLHRLTERNQRDDANALTVTPEALDDFLARFDAPDDEGEQVVSGGTPDSVGGVQVA